MAVPYFNSHSLNPDAQKAYGPAVSNIGSVLNGCPQRSSVVFGLEVQQAAPNNYLNTSNPYGESFHNLFSDYRFPKVLVRQAPEQSEPLGLSDTTRAQQQSDENILYNGRSGFRIDHVWSMAVKADSQSHSINANHSSLDSTLKDTAGNGSSSMGPSTPQISSVVDNTSQKQSEKRKASRKAYEQSEKGQAARKAYGQSERGKAARKASRQSDKYKAYQKDYQKDYQKAYRQSDRGKASRKAYEQSEKGKATSRAYQKAYRQSDKSKAYQKTYQKAYQKAYREVFDKTGDIEQAKIAGKQATAFMRKSNKFRNSELESITISPLTPSTASRVGRKVNDRRVRRYWLSSSG